MSTTPCLLSSDMLSCLGLLRLVIGLSVCPKQLEKCEQPQQPPTRVAAGGGSAASFDVVSARNWTMSGADMLAGMFSVLNRSRSESPSRQTRLRWTSHVSSMLTPARRARSVETSASNLC